MCYCSRRPGEWNEIIDNHQQAKLRERESHIINIKMIINMMMWFAVERNINHSCRGAAVELIIFIIIELTSDGERRYAIIVRLLHLLFARAARASRSHWPQRAQSHTCRAREKYNCTQTGRAAAAAAAVRVRWCSIAHKIYS